MAEQHLWTSVISVASRGISEEGSGFFNEMVSHAETATQHLKKSR